MNAPHAPLPESYPGLLAQAQAELQAGNLVAAIDHYQRIRSRIGRLSPRVLDRRPDLREIRLRASREVADVLYLEGRFAEAIEVKEELLQAYPGEAASLRRELAVLRLAKGEPERGLAELRSLAEDLPTDARNWIVLAVESRIEGRFAESQTALDRALATAGKDEVAVVHYQRFLLLRDTKRLDDALLAWEQAVSADPQALASVRQVYTMLTEVGRYSEALQYVARDENTLQAGFQRGLVAHLTGSPTKAHQEWQAVAMLNPLDFPAGHDGWVESVLRLGNSEQALGQLQALLAQYGTSRLLVLSGIAWAMHHDPDMAGKLFQEAISVQRLSRAPRQKLDSADWRLLDSLVADDKIKMALKPYFVVIQTVWG